MSLILLPCLCCTDWDVPSIEVLENVTGWRDTSKDSENIYTSAAGSYIWALLPSGNEYSFVSDYNFETSYLQAGCSDWSLLTSLGMPNGTPPSSILAMNMTGSSAPQAAGNYSQPRNFTVSDRYNSSLKAQASCSIHQKYVEVNTHCDGTSCVARKVRFSRMDQ